MMLNHDQLTKALKQGKIKLTPPPTKIGSNSIDLTLHPHILQYILTKKHPYLDPHKSNLTTTTHIPPKGIILKPGTLLLGRTNEINTNNNNHLVPMLSGRSSLARLGLSIHQTAGFGDIGFSGTWTLEITTIHPIKLYPNMPIAQLYYITTKPTNHTYNHHKHKAKYMNQINPTPSKLHQEKF